MHRRSTLLLAVVCGVLVSPSAEGRPQSDRALGLNPLTASELELQRVPVSPLELQGLGPAAALNTDYSHAIYAGRFAQQLNRLEKSRNQIYVDFISSGFTGTEVPRELPSDLQMLSRTAPTPSLLFSSSSSSLARTGPISSSSFVFPADQVFSSKSFIPRRVDRQEFVRKTRARGFPITSDVGVVQK